MIPKLILSAHLLLLFGCVHGQLNAEDKAVFYGSVASRCLDLHRENGTLMTRDESERSFSDSYDTLFVIENRNTLTSRLLFQKADGKNQNEIGCNYSLEIHEIIGISWRLGSSSDVSFLSFEQYDRIHRDVKKRLQNHPADDLFGVAEYYYPTRRVLKETVVRFR